VARTYELSLLRVHTWGRAHGLKTFIFDALRARQSIAVDNRTFHPPLLPPPGGNGWHSLETREAHFLVEFVPSFSPETGHNPLTR
jgi:hypothetical protein